MIALARGGGGTAAADHARSVQALHLDRDWGEIKAPEPPL